MQPAPALAGEAHGLRAQETIHGVGQMNVAGLPVVAVEVQTKDRHEAVAVRDKAEAKAALDLVGSAVAGDGAELLMTERASFAMRPPRG